MKPFNHPIIRISNNLWGGAAAAMLGATLAEWQKRREEEAARLAALRNSGGGEEGDSDAADKKRMKVLARVNPAYARSLTQERNTRAAIAKVTAQELKGTNISVAQAQARQQAQWDANGQAIYAANQQFKETYGKEMDAATKEQAIKDATVNGVFNAGLYSVNLNTAQAKLEKAAEEQRRAEQAAMLEAQRQAAEEAARQNAMADFRAGERDAIAIAAEYEREQAMQSYRAGEQVAQEKTNGNLLSALWNASMSAVGSILLPKDMGGGAHLPVRGDAPPNPFEKLKIWVNDNIVQPVKEWTELKIEQSWPAIRATGPGKNGISLVNKYRDVIIGTISSFDSLIKINGSIPYTYEYTNGKGKTIQKQQDHSVPINPTSLAISMSVQAEAPGFIDFFQWVFRPFNNPSYGMAQIEPDKYELIKQNIQPYVNLDWISNNPYVALQNPQVATAAMIERISPSLEVCQKYDCTPTDREIVIALSQNGPGFSAERLEGILNDIEYVSESPETIIDWQKYFNDQKTYSREEGAYRYYILNWRASGHNFDTWFMLNRYYNNAMVFEDAGNWSMPEGVEWSYIESLIENTLPAQP